MGSVAFSDSYRIASIGYPTNYIRVDYSEVEYDAANNRTKVRLDGVYVKSDITSANSRCFGTLKFNGATVLTMSGDPYTVRVESSYQYIANTSNGATVWVSHNSAGAASLTVSLEGGSRNDDNDLVFGALYLYGTGFPIMGVRTPASATVSLTPHTSTLTVDPNGGEWEGSSSQQTFSQAPTSTKLIASPSRTGYTFTGWSLTGGGSLSGETYTFGATSGTLTAQWRVNSYNVSLTAGDNIASVSGAGGHDYGSSVEVSAVPGAIPGYTYVFDGWYDGGTKVSGSNPYAFSMPAADVALLARADRTANAYTVHFDANGGSGSMADESFTYDQAKVLTANSFTRTGYTFLGWSENPSDITPVYSDEQSVSNLATSGTVTLYAIWQLDIYLLSISTSHGLVSVVRDDSPIGSGSIGALPNGAALYYNDELTITFVAATGYTISVHTVNGSPFVSGNTHVVTGEVTIVQDSTANTYSVVFNANRGTGSGGGAMANQTFTYDVEQNLTANAFTRFFTATFDANGGAVETPSAAVYCSFLGWGRTESDAVQYTNQQRVSNLAPSGTITLYAKWQYGRATFPGPTRTGYTFRGWYDAPSGGNKIANAGGSIALSADTTFYAQWDAVTYPLSLEASDNGVVVNVMRTASPYGGGASGLLSDGATLYYGDSLTITYAIGEGYQKRQATVNGVDFGGDYSGSASIPAVSSALSVIVLVKLGAIVYIGNEAYQAFIGAADGSAYVQYEGFFGNAGGTAWDAY